METGLPGLSQAEASKLLTSWQANPLTYFDQVLGIEKIWKLQKELSLACPVAIKEHKHIYVGSGNSLGKDYICGALSNWFLDSFSPSIVINTGPTDRQVKKVMWGEVANHWNNKKIKLGGTIYTNPSIEYEKGKWYYIGFTTKETGASKDAQGGKFLGFHAPNMMVVVTEAQSIEDVIFDQIDAVATTENVLVIFIGNPTRAKGRFAKGLKNVDGRNITFNFDCRENPNYKQRKTVIPGLASYEWVEDKKIKWGLKDPRWQGRIEGRVPDVGVNKVITDMDLKIMKSKHGFLALYGDNAGVVVDVAGEGIDDNVYLGGRSGEVICKEKVCSIAPSASAIKAVEMCKKINGSWIVVDCDGMGIRDYQELTSLSEHYLNGIQIIKFHGSSRIPKPEDSKIPAYYNLRAFAAFITQERARSGKAGMDPEATEMIEDLVEEDYFEKEGTIRIEDKTDIKERLDRSPGEGDAFKMLQWAFEQDFKALDFTQSNKSALPRYAMADNTAETFAGASRDLPRTAVAGNTSI